MTTPLLSVHRDAPSAPGTRTAALGSFSFPSREAGEAAVREILSVLRHEGFERVLAPMDGDTWRRYRVTTESDGSPPFAMEPVSGPHDLAVLRGCGFATASRYVSARVRLDQAVAVRVARVEGIRIETWDGDDGEALFGTIFDMSSAGFAGAAHFRPIPRSDFVELYRPILGRVDPRRVHFAKDGDGRIVGYLFGLPDLAAGPGTGTVILKTYASAVRGVGRMLADAFHADALRDGYDTAVHALMREDNPSLASSAGYGAEVFRRYELMEVGP